MSELEELRRKKLAAMQAAAEQGGEQEQFAQQVEQLEAICRGVMSPEAMQRYGTLKLAHPETALRSLVVVAQLARQGKRITDDAYKSILQQIAPKKREVRINA